MTGHSEAQLNSSRVAGKKRAWSRSSDGDGEDRGARRYAQDVPTGDGSRASSLPAEYESAPGNAVQFKDEAGAVSRVSSPLTITVLDTQAESVPTYTGEPGDAFPSRGWPEPVDSAAVLRRRWVSDDVIYRLVTQLLDTPLRSRALFPLSQIPSEATWGPKSSRVDMSGQLCWWDMPMTVRAIGYIARLMFTADTIEPIPRVVVGLELLRPLDQLGLERCLRRIGCNVPEGTIPQFEASRTAYGRHTLERFRDVYEAPRTLEPGDISRVPCSELIVGDLVVVDVELRRLMTVAGWGPSGATMPGTSVWFEIHAMYRVCSRLADTVPSLGAVLAERGGSAPASRR